MHIILVLGLLGLALGILILALARMSPQARHDLALWAFWLLIVGLVIFLTLTGRLPWQAAATLGILSMLQWLYSSWRARHPRKIDPPDDPAQATMTRADALETLGLKNGATRTQIIEAHRRLMQKFHPDRGGSDALAARINSAKDLLLGNQKNGD
ncbi:MAG: molecular chaperone DnaJ [Pseudomonadota bacterium]